MKGSCNDPSGTGHPLHAWWPPLRRTAIALGLMIAGPGGALAADGDPLGPEFQVNTAADGNQRIADAACDSVGNCVVVWQGARALDVFAQRLGTDGQPLGTEFRVNALRPGSVDAPAVAMNATGRFVVAWSAAASFTAPHDIHVRVFNPDGSALSDEIAANSSTAGDQLSPDVAYDPDGDYVVVWRSEPLNGQGLRGIFGRRIASDAAVAGNEFRIDAEGPATFALNDPAVSMNRAGNFNVAWASRPFREESFTTTTAIWSRDFLQDGRSGQPFAVEEIPGANDLREPVVWLDDSDHLLVAYRARRDTHPTVNMELYGRHFAGASVFDFRADDGTFEGGGALDLAGARDASGRFTLVWDALDAPGDGNRRGVRARRFSYGLQAGQPFVAALAAPVLVNTLGLSDQFDPAIADATAGGTLVCWTSLLQDGDGDGIFAQRFAGREVDTRPRRFRFRDLVDVEANRVLRSNAILVRDIDAPAALTIGGRGARYSINGGPFIGTPGTVEAGDSVRLRLRSSPLPGTAARAVLTIGGVRGIWRVTTAAAEAQEAGTSQK